MTDDEHTKCMQFVDAFGHLLREHFPDYPGDAAQDEMLMLVQDNISVFSPYFWDDKFRPVKK